jgi:hypothetical protein
MIGYFHIECGRQPSSPPHRRWGGGPLKAVEGPRGSAEDATPTLFRPAAPVGLLLGSAGTPPSDDGGEKRARTSPLNGDMA